MRSGILGGGVWMADGAELLLIGSVADVLSREWELSRFLKGFVVTIVYTGLMVGNISSGPAGARLGRREVIVCSYAGIFLFSILSSTAGGIGVLLLWRFIVGWTLPSLTLLCFCWPFLHQSPTFLQLKGRHAEAVEVLESMKQDNGALDVSVDFRLAPPPPPEGFLQVMGRQAKVIMSNRLWVPTIAVTYSCFIINLSYYGSLYAFPQVLSSLIDSSLSDKGWTSFSGILVGCVLGMMYPRHDAFSPNFTTTASEA
eukprot:g28610.t1